MNMSKNIISFESRKTSLYKTVDFENKMIKSKKSLFSEVGGENFPLPDL